MSYLIFYDQYAPLLSAQNEDIVKNAFQELFEHFVRGARIAKTQKGLLIDRISTHINSKSQKVRKWTYHCACFYQNDFLLDSIKRQLKTERDTENIMWALTALSRRYDNENCLRECAGGRHEEFMTSISKEYLRDALVLFGRVDNMNPSTVLETNNSADLLALTKIYAYNTLVPNKYPMITQEVIRELVESSDPGVREYAYWAQVVGMSDGRADFSSDDSVEEVRKWQIAMQIQDNGEDFVVSALRPLSLCPEKVSLQIKAGVLRGLKTIPYSEAYARLLFDWYDEEENDFIEILLLDYMLANCYNNRDEGTFYDALRDALKDEKHRQYIQKRVIDNSQFKLKVIGNTDTIDLLLEDREVLVMTNISVSGNNNSLAVAQDGSEATSTINCNTMNESKLNRIIEDIKKYSEESLSAEDQRKVKESIAFIEEEIKKSRPNKTVMQSVLSGLRAIKGSVQFAAAVTSLIKFLQGVS